MTSLRDTERVLVLIGGVLALILGILSLVGYGIGRFGHFEDFSFGLGPIIEIVAGILAIALYRKLGNLGVIAAWITPILRRTHTRALIGVGSIQLTL